MSKITWNNLYKIQQKFHRILSRPSSMTTKQAKFKIIRCFNPSNSNVFNRQNYINPILKNNDVYTTSIVKNLISKIQIIIQTRFKSSRLRALGKRLHRDEFRTLRLARMREMRRRVRTDPMRGASRPLIG